MSPSELRAMEEANSERLVLSPQSWQLQEASRSSRPCGPRTLPRRHKDRETERETERHGEREGEEETTQFHESWPSFPACHAPQCLKVWEEVLCFAL